MRKNEVCIELHTDDNYVIPTIITITSILQNKNKNSIYKIRVLGNNLSLENENLLKQLDIQFIPHKNQFHQFEGKHEFVSSTDLFKFDLPNVLADWDKVLYIDTDMIVQGDLSELFNTDLKDNYVAAVKDMAGMVSEKHHEKLNLPNYFNAGMMLLNLKKMREDDISQKLVDYKLHKDCGHFMSQDALNYVFNEQVVWLSPKYNYMASNLTTYSDYCICDFYEINPGELKNIKKHAVIMHLTNKFKPWKYKNVYGHKLWTKYKNKSICKNIKLTYDKVKKEKKRISILKRIFSIGNEFNKNAKHKVVNIFGIKFKFRKEFKK